MFQEKIKVRRTVFEMKDNANVLILLSLITEDGTFAERVTFDYQIYNEIDIWNGHIYHSEMSIAFDAVPEFRRMKPQMIEAILEMRENDLAIGMSNTAVEIPLLPKEKLKPHTYVISIRM